MSRPHNAPIWLCVLALALLAAQYVSAQALIRIRITTEASSSGLPLLTQENILGGTAVGARVPITASNGRYYSSGSPSAITWDADSSTLYATNHEGYLATLTLPTMVNSSTIGSLNTASFSQGFMEPTEGEIRESDPDSCGSECAMPWGLLAISGDSSLYGTVSVNYDAGNLQRSSHYSRPKNLSTTGQVKGMDEFGREAEFGLSLAGNGYAGFVSGYLFRVPSEWQSSFGGYQVGSGQCCQSVISRNSYGPSAGLFDRSLIGSAGTQPYLWKPLVAYPGAHPTLGCWDEPDPLYPSVGHSDPMQGCWNTYFTYTTRVRTCVMINGTRTFACFGTQGSEGYACYGVGTATLALHMTLTGEDAHTVYCYDPAAAGTKSNHQYPYVYQAWLFDVEDLVEAYNGSVNYWVPIPYGGTTFTFPVAAPTSGGAANVLISGGDYDAATQSLYLMQSNVDNVGNNWSGIIWKFPVTIP